MKTENTKAVCHLGDLGTDRRIMYVKIIIEIGYGNTELFNVAQERFQLWVQHRNETSGYERLVIS
jgi:hypothetical protein